MKPVSDATASGRPPSSRSAAEPASTPARGDLQMLSAAGTRYADIIERTKRRRRPNILIAVLAGVLLGTVVTFASPFLYRGTAVFRLVGHATTEHRARFRAELLDFAWARTQPTDEDVPWLEQPRVYSDGDASLAVSAITRRRSEALLELKTLAADFVERTQREAETARHTPGQTEALLAEIGADLQQRVTEAEARVDAAVAAVPPTDPSRHRDALLTRWQALRSNLSTARRQLTAATSAAAQFKTEPTDGAAIVSVNERRRRIAADRALQQDLRELAVNLTELKQHLLDVWQESAGPLERLKADARELHKVANVRQPPSPAASASDPAATSITTALGTYRDGLEVFGRRWDQAFTALRLMKVDAMSGEVLDVFQRIRRDLNDFLFDAGKRLSTLRSLVRSLDANPIDAARRHVFHSDLIRAFQTVEAAHHRFEFAAGTIDTPTNFRLDAALTSARGLRRRCHERLYGIEETLLTEAKERARKRRLKALDRAESAIRGVRSATDRTVDELIGLQEELNLGAGLTESFLRATLRAEVAAARLTLFRAGLQSSAARLRAIAERRTAGADAVRVAVDSCGVETRPFNLRGRLRSGGISAVLAFFAVFFGQWWVTRPRWLHPPSRPPA